MPSACSGHQKPAGGSWGIPGGRGGSIERTWGVGGAAQRDSPAERGASTQPAGGHQHCRPLRSPGRARSRAWALPSHREEMAEGEGKAAGRFAGVAAAPDHSSLGVVKAHDGELWVTQITAEDACLLCLLSSDKLSLITVRLWQAHVLGLGGASPGADVVPPLGEGRGSRWWSGLRNARYETWKGFACYLCPGARCAFKGIALLK